MRSDPGTFFANLESEENKKDWQKKGKKICTTFIFIDDLTVLNDDAEFERRFRETFFQNWNLGSRMISIQKFHFRFGYENKGH